MIDPLTVGLNGLLGLNVVEEDRDTVRMDMPVSSSCLQPFGFVHGGATLALLEAAASRGAELRCNLGCERPFGTHVDITHVKNCRQGTVHGTAVFESEQDLGERGTRQTWRVQATDDSGAVMSTGTLETRIVPLAYLESKSNARKANE